MGEITIRQGQVENQSITEDVVLGEAANALPAGGGSKCP